MNLTWLPWLRRTETAPMQWRLLVHGTELATLRHPVTDEMFWTSFEIVPSTSPPDPRLRDDAFWLDGGWQLTDVTTGRAAPLAIASAEGLRQDGRRVLLRGLDANRNGR